MKYLLSVLLCFSPCLLFSQGKTWSLEDCMRYAVENSTTRAKQEAQNEIYRQSHREAIGNMLPSLNAGTGASTSFGRGLDPETNTYTNVNSFNNSYEIYSSVVLFDGLYRASLVKLYKLNRLKGEHQLQYVEDMLAYETMAMFFNVLYYKGAVALAQQQLEESSANLKQVERMEELGLKSAPDVAEMLAKEAEDRYTLTKQVNLYNLELIRLKEKMNYPIEEELQVSDVQIVEPAGKKQEDVAGIFNGNMGYSPKILSAAKELEASRMELKGVKGRVYPTISLNGGFNTGFSRLMNNSDYIPFGEQLSNKRGYYVSASLSIPIFNGFSRSANIGRSKQNVIIAENNYNETLRTVYSEIDRAVSDLNGLADEYGQSAKKTQAMEMAHQVNQRKYSEGLISAIELSTSSNRLLQSRVEKLYTGLKYQLQDRLVNYYKGRRLISTEN
ncbi:MAG: TolC family protein [Prevotellaceae bacterium]|jgi:outer membrane protein|nr:TolC family protein [Prevotellaceae bacterium]